MNFFDDLKLVHPSTILFCLPLSESWGRNMQVWQLCKKKKEIKNGGNSFSQHCRFCNILWWEQPNPLFNHDQTAPRLSVLLCAPGVMHHWGHLTCQSCQQHARIPAQAEQWTIVHSVSPRRFFQWSIENLPIVEELDTVFHAKLFCVNRLHSKWDHDSSKRVSQLMDRENLCAMCFCDMNISHNFHSQCKKATRCHVVQSRNQRCATDARSDNYPQTS